MLRRVGCVHLRHFATALATEASGSFGNSSRKEFRIAVALIIERPPLVAPEMNEIEKQYSDLCHTMEMEESLLSKHERNLAEEIKYRTRKDRGDNVEVPSFLRSKDISPRELEVFVKKREQLFQTKFKDQKLKPSTDLRSVLREFTESIFLTVNQEEDVKPGRSFWGMPLKVYANETSLKKTCEALVSDMFDSKSARHVSIDGNAPVGFYEFSLPPEAAKTADFDKTKLFFFRGRVKKGEKIVLSENNGKLLDYAWLTKPEMKAKLKEANPNGKPFRRALFDCLL